MHPAWIDANYQSDDPDHVEQQAQQVPRLNQLNIHLLLPYNLLLLWDEHSRKPCCWILCRHWAWFRSK